MGSKRDDDERRLLVSGSQATHRVRYRGGRVDRSLCSCRKGNGRRTRVTDRMAMVCLARNGLGDDKEKSIYEGHVRRERKLTERPCDIF